MTKFGSVIGLSWLEDDILLGYSGVDYPWLDEERFEFVIVFKTRLPVWFLSELPLLIWDSNLLAERCSFEYVPLNVTNFKRSHTEYK